MPATTLGRRSLKGLALFKGPLQTISGKKKNLQFFIDFPKFVFAFKVLNCFALLLLII